MSQDTPINTEQLIAENKRLKSQVECLSNDLSNWHRTLFEENNQAMAICATFSDLPSSILDCNSEFRTLLKYSNQQIINKDFMDLMRKGEKHKFFIHSLVSPREGEFTDFPVTFVAGDGNELNMEISSICFASPKGRLVLVKLQKRSHHKSILRNGIEQLLSQSSQIFFCICKDEALEFDYVSLSIAKVTGYSSEQLLINPFIFWNNCHPEDLLVLRKALKSAQNYKDNLTLRFICQDGQMIWLNFSILSSPSQEGGETNYYAVAREITAQQKRERQLKKKEFYDQLVLQSAQSLIGQVNTMKLKSLANYIGSQLQGDRFSIYIHEGVGQSFSHDVFADYVTLNTKTYAASNSRIWEEFKDEFINLPVLLYQSDDDNFKFKDRHLAFFSRIKVKSALIIPLIHQNNTLGFVACSTLIKHYCWDRTDINYLSQFSMLLSLACQTNNEV